MTFSNIVLKDKFKKLLSRSHIPNAEEHGKLIQLLQKYSECFSSNEEQTRVCGLVEHTIKLKNHDPVYKPQYPLPYAAQDALKEQVNEFLQEGIIKHSNSPYNAPMWMVPKKDGTFCMVINFHNLNKQVVTDPFPMPLITNIFNHFHRMCYWSSFDVKWGFFTLKVNPQQTYLLAFTALNECFEFTRVRTTDADSFLLNVLYFQVLHFYESRWYKYYFRID